MDLTVLIPRSHVLLNLTGTTRREMLRTLAQPLAEDKIVTDLEQFLDDVERREDQITTQIGKDIAIPHARSGTVRRLGLTLGLASKPGLRFDADAPHPCHFLFLVAIPSFSPTAHLGLLQVLVHFANDRRRLEKLGASKTPAQAISTLLSFKWHP